MPLCNPESKEMSAQPNRHKHCSQGYAEPGNHLAVQTSEIILQMCMAFIDKARNTFNSCDRYIKSPLKDYINPRDIFLTISPNKPAILAPKQGGLVKDWKPVGPSR